MKINESGFDRIVRIVMGLALIVLGWSGLISGWLGTAVWIGFIPLLTGMVGFCPLYAVLNFHTNKV